MGRAARGAGAAAAASAPARRPSPREEAAWTGSPPGTSGGFIAEYCLPQQGVWGNDEPGVLRPRPRAALAVQHREAAGELPRAGPGPDSEVPNGEHPPDERCTQRLEEILQQLLSKQGSVGRAQLEQAVERLEQKLDGIQVQFGAGLRSINDDCIGNLEDILRRGIEAQKASIVETLTNHLAEAAVSHKEAAAACATIGHHWDHEDNALAGADPMDEHYDRARLSEDSVETNIPEAKVGEPSEHVDACVEEISLTSPRKGEMQQAEAEAKEHAFRGKTVFDMTDSISDDEMQQVKDAAKGRAFRGKTLKDLMSPSLKLGHLGFRGALIDWLEIHEPVRTGRLVELNERLAYLFLAVVGLNVAFMILTVDREIEQIRDTGEARVEPWVVQVEIAFLSLYTIELVLKIIVHRLYFFVNSDFIWNWLDVGLVLYSTVEVVSMLVYHSIGGGYTFLRVVRIFKMAKVARIFRLISSFKELRLILGCIIGSSASFFWSLTFITFIYFIFAMILVHGVGIFLASQDNVAPEQEALFEHFGSIQICILTLYRASMGGDDWSMFYFELKRAGVSWHLQALFLYFIAFTQIALLNTITGIFVERAMEQGKPTLIQRSREHVGEEAELAAELKHLLKDFDTNENGFVDTASFFDRAPHHPLNLYLRFLGVDDRDMREFLQKTGAIQEEGVLLSDFVRGCMKVKGAASNLDMQSVIFGLKLLQADMERQERKVVRLSRHLGMRSDEVRASRTSSQREAPPPHRRASSQYL